MASVFRVFFSRPVFVLKFFAFLFLALGLGNFIVQANALPTAGNHIAAASGGHSSAHFPTPHSMADQAIGHKTIVSAIATMPSHLRVGIVEAAPLAFFDSTTSAYKGIGVDIFKEIANLFTITYTFVPLSLDGALEALTAKKVDIIIGPFNAHEATVLGTASVPYFYSGLSIASPTIHSTVFQALGSLLTSSNFLLPCFGLIGFLLVIAIIYTGFKRVYGKDTKPLPQSLFESFGWATIAFSTIDMKILKGNIFLAFCAIFAFFITIAGSMITATVTSNLTLEQLHPFITQASDLRNIVVAAKKDSAGAQYLETKAIPFRDFASLKKAVEATLLGETKAIVDDELFLRYTLKHLNVYSLSLLPLNLTRNSYVMLFSPAHTPWMPAFNKALSNVASNPLGLKAIATPYVGYVPHLDQN